MKTKIVKITYKDEPTILKGVAPKNLTSIPPMTKAEKKAFLTNWMAAIPAIQIEDTSSIIILGTP